MSQIHGLQQCQKFIDGQARLPDNPPQCTPIKFFVIGYNGLTERLITAHEYVAASLPDDDKSCFLKRPDTFPTRNSG
jgi:hypothetical protein